MDDPLLTVYTLGGRVRPVTYAEVDDWAARALAEINVDVAFLGTTAVSLNRGLTPLADRSKFGKASNCKHADLADIDLLLLTHRHQPPDADVPAFNRPPDGIHLTLHQWNPSDLHQQ